MKSIKSHLLNNLSLWDKLTELYHSVSPVIQSTSHNHNWKYKHYKREDYWCKHQYNELYHKERIFEFITIHNNMNYDLNHCVYMIEDFYIGRTSDNLKNRIIGQMHEMFYEYYNDKLGYDVYVNKDKVQSLIDHFKGNNKLNVYILSDNPLDEDKYIQSALKEGYKLTNIKMNNETIEIRNTNRSY